jgi:hypothetical protein
MTPRHRIRSLPVLLLALAAGCSDDTTAPPNLSPAPAVRFDALAVGQASRFLFFHCTMYGQRGSGTQIYAPDTLVLAVVDESGSRFRIEERLTPGSISHHDSVNVWDPDSTYSYWLEPAPDSLFVHHAPGEGSRLFVAPTQRFSIAPVDSNETRFVEWQPDVPYHEDLWSGFVRDHVQLGRSFDRLNVLQDNRTMAFDGPGYLFVQSGPHGLVRWATYSWWTGDGYGWDLLPP